MGAFSTSGFTRASQSSGGLSPLQLATLAEAASQPREGDTIFDKIIHGTGAGFGWLFDKLLRPSYGYMAGLSAGLKEDNFGDAVKAFATNFGSGFLGEKKIGFGQILEEQGLLKNHDFLRGLVGFTGDVVFDPLNAVTFGAAKLPTVAGKVITKSDPLYEAVIAGRGALEGFQDIATAKKAADILGKAGPGFEARRALAEFQADEFLPKVLSNTETSVAENSLLASIRRLAETEDAVNATKAFQVSLKVPFVERTLPLTPSNIGGAHIPLPKLSRTAEGSGVLGKLPLAPAIATGIGKVFKPGFQDETFHAGLLTAQKVAQLQTDTMLRAYQPVAMQGTKLGKDSVMDALHLGESTPGIVKDGALDVSVVNDLVATGKLSQEQAQFLGEWHKLTEYLRQQDENFNVAYDKPGGVGAGNQGVMYVPHVYSRTGEKLGAGHPIRETYLKQFGFTKNRKGLTTIQQLRELEAAGALKRGVETDPVKLMISRIRSGALNQANQNMLDSFVKAFGRPAREADLARAAQIDNLIAQREAKIASLTAITASGQRSIMSKARREINKKRDAKIAEATKTHLPKVQHAESQVQKWAAEVKKYARYTVPKVTRQMQAELDGLQQQVDEIDTLLKSLTKAGPGPVTYDGFVDNVIDVENSLSRLLVDKPANKTWVDHATGLLPQLQKDLLSKKSAVAQIRELETALTMQKLLSEKVAQLEPLVEYIRSRGGQMYGNDAAMLADIVGDVPLGRYKDLYSLVSKKLLPQMQAELTTANETATRLAKKFKDEHLRKKAWAQMQLSNAQSALTKRQAALAERVDNITQQHESLYQRRIIAEIDDKAEGQYAEFEKQLDKIDKLEAKKLKALNDGKSVSYDQLLEDIVDMPGRNGKAYVLPKEVANGITRVRSVVTRDDVARTVANAYDRWLGKWKVLATVVTPGYASRNTATDFWNAWVSGVPAGQMVVYGGKAAAFMRTALKAENKLAHGQALDASEKAVYKEYIAAQAEGIFSGLFQGDVDTIAHALESGGKPAIHYLKSGRPRPYKAYARGMTTLNRHRENWVRLTHYLYRREAQGLSVSDSARWIRKVHFDYEDVTEFERRVFKRILPFYTWSRKNIPFQLEALMSRPGRFAAFPKFINEMETASGDSETDIVPDFIKHSFGFKLPIGPDGTYLLPQIGAADFRLLEHPEDIKGMLTPAFRIPAEILSGKNLNTGADIQGVHPRAPVADWVAKALGWIPGNPLNVGQTERTVGTEQVSGAGASPWLAYVAGLTPLTNFLVNQQSDIRSTQRGGAVFPLLSTGGGLSLFRPDNEGELAIAQLEFEDKMRRMIRGLRDENLIEEPEDQGLSPYQQQLMELIRRSVQRGS